MKQIVKLISGLSLALALSACSGFFQQDPLGDKADAIRKAKKVREKPEPPPPQDSDGVRVEAPDFFSFQEGRRDVIEIHARVLLAKYTVALMINNLSTFPGATYDATTGKFTWMPPKGTVVDTDFYRDMTIDVTAVASPQDPLLPILRRTSKVRAVIGRTIGIPEIVQVNKSIRDIREGDKTRIAVIVRDNDAGFKPDQYPAIEVLAGDDDINLAPFVTVGAVTPGVSPGQWTFNLDLDLSNQEVTRSVANGSFNIRAVSRFSKTSAPAKIDFKVLTDIGKPQTTWETEQVVIPGQQNQVHFLIYDPRREAKMAIGRKSNFPQGSDLTCTNQVEGILECTMTWTPPYNTAEQHLRLAITAVATNQNFYDRTKEESDLWLPLMVKFVPAPKTPEVTREN